MFSKTLPPRLTPYVVTIVTAAETTDRYGNTVKDWANATRFETRAYIEQQQSSSEETVDRSMQTSRWLLMTPAGVSFNGRDRVEYDGQTFEVIGPPRVVFGLRGAHHIEAVLQWMEG